MTNFRLPPVVGLYGVSASGKTHLLKQVRALLGSYDFSYHEGAGVISRLCPEGLDGFKCQSEVDQTQIRQTAIRQIQDEASQDGKLAVVAGHYSFWNAVAGVAIPALTPEDLKVYTHIIYLNTPPDVVLEQSRQDSTRKRRQLSLAQISAWQQTEVTDLHRTCNEHAILFSVVVPVESLPLQVANRLRHFKAHSKENNDRQAKHRLDTVLAEDEDCRAVIVLDADKTIAPVDTGSMFWARINELIPFHHIHDPLKVLFGGPMAYSDQAFRQAILLYQDVSSITNFDEICKQVSNDVLVPEEMVAFLQAACNLNHVKIVILTCGLELIWRRVIDNLNLPCSVHVVGSGLIQNGLVITPRVKGELISHLKNVHHQMVYAIGDGPLDMAMLERADEAFVVVYDEHVRSKSMERLLSEAIMNRELQAHQILLQGTTKPRLDPEKLPIVELSQVLHWITNVVESVQTQNRVIDFTEDDAAKLLTTDTRDSTVSGPALRKAHKAVGRYLALCGLTQVIGVEEYPIPHVQGNTTIGHRIKKGYQMTIIALMRGGEPLAFGVSEIIPKAMFLHVKEPKDIARNHIESQSVVAIVDSVINTGKSVVEIIDHIRNLSADVQIVIIAGVVQDGAIQPDSLLGRILRKDKHVNLVALRLSKNKYKGSGNTDTGNRLFNTQHIE